MRSLSVRYYSAIRSRNEKSLAESHVSAQINWMSIKSRAGDRRFATMNLFVTPSHSGERCKSMTCSAKHFHKSVGVTCNCDGGVMVSIVAFQAVDPGSIPGHRRHIFGIFYIISNI